jgi:DNA polymerase-3 subunit epsilon
MLHDAPPCEEVMRAFAQFIEGFNLVAHNASFDARFLQAEFARAGVAQHGPFACSMLISRRLYPDAPNHKLGTLVHYRSLPNDGTFHRALADAQMTAHLWLGMLRDLETGYGVGSPPFSVMQRLSRTARSKVATLLAGVRSEAASR